MLQKNINLTGRIVRAVLGLILLAYGIWQMSWLAILGAFFTFFEAYMSWCIVYQLLGINRCPLKKNKESEKTKNSKK